MPSIRDFLAATGSLRAGWTAATLLLVGLPLAWADHGVPAPARTGSSWMSWLLVAGAVVAVGLAGWAFFAPDRGDAGPQDPAPPGRASAEPPPR
jgi:LPXTG-motif cell wall-anchored protein